MQSAIEEERYMDATYIRDHAGAGLVSIAKFLLMFLLYRYIICMQLWNTYYVPVAIRVNNSGPGIREKTDQ